MRATKMSAAETAHMCAPKVSAAASGVHPQRLNAGATYWYRDLMEAAGLKGRVAYARWSGDEARFAWEVGVGKGTFLLARAKQRPDVDFLGIEYARD